MNFFIKNPNLTKKKIWRLGGEGLRCGYGMSEKKNCFLFEGVKVREDWLVSVILFYKESRSKKKISILFLYLFLSE